MGLILKHFGINERFSTIWIVKIPFFRPMAPDLNICSSQWGRIWASVLISQPLLILYLKEPNVGLVTHIKLMIFVWPLWMWFFCMICVANLLCFSYMLKCATSYRSSTYERSNDERHQTYIIRSEISVKSIPNSKSSGHCYRAYCLQWQCRDTAKVSL